MMLFKVIDSHTFTNNDTDWNMTKTEVDISIENKIYDDQKITNVIRNFEFFVTRIRNNRNVYIPIDMKQNRVEITSNKITVEGYDMDTDERIIRVIQIQEITEISDK